MGVMKPPTRKCLDLFQQPHHKKGRLHAFGRRSAWGCHHHGTLCLGASATRNKRNAGGASELLVVNNHS